MNTMNEFDLQFKIFTQVDTTKSYVILNESINKLLSVSQSIVLTGYELSETNFNDHNRQTCSYIFRNHNSNVRGEANYRSNAHILGASYNYKF